MDQVEDDGRLVTRKVVRDAQGEMKWVPDRGRSRRNRGYGVDEGWEVVGKRRKEAKGGGDNGKEKENWRHGLSVEKEKAAV